MQLAVQKRMLFIGFCLPDFVKKNTSLWLAMDNFDFENAFQLNGDVCSEREHTEFVEREQYGPNKLIS